MSYKNRDDVNEEALGSTWWREIRAEINIDPTSTWLRHFNHHYGANETTMDETTPVLDALRRIDAHPSASPYPETSLVVQTHAVLASPR
ncbi:hypothetical protein CC2G_015102 [Coprinopsis cinerea AmutBmut pab1-1]|nr:hypothetical protein CC2G_015102 [Coprinopsis cinerea AmutBmut pab1-1]